MHILACASFIRAHVVVEEAPTVDAFVQRGSSKSCSKREPEQKHPVGVTRFHSNRLLKSARQTQVAGVKQGVRANDVLAPAQELAGVRRDFPLQIRFERTT